MGAPHAGVSHMPTPLVPRAAGVEEGRGVVCRARAIVQAAGPSPHTKHCAISLTKQRRLRTVKYKNPTLPQQTDRHSRPLKDALRSCLPRSPFGPSEPWMRARSLASFAAAEPELGLQPLLAKAGGGNAVGDGRLGAPGEEVRATQLHSQISGPWATPMVQGAPWTTPGCAQGPWVCSHTCASAPTALHAARTRATPAQAQLS